MMLIPARQWLASCVIGICCAATVGYHLLELWRHPLAEQALGVELLALGFAPIVFVLLGKFVAPRLRKWPRVIAFAALLGAVGWFVIPLSPIPLSVNRLEIVASGEKNPRALASEVWVWGIQWLDKTRVPLAQIERVGDWEMRGDALLSYQNQPARLRWEGVLDDGLNLAFGMHPFSGVVVVRWNDEEQRVDLYSADESPKGIARALPAASWFEQSKRKTLLALALGAADITSLGFIMLVALEWLLTRDTWQKSARVKSNRAWIAYAVLPLIVWSVYLIAFLPALMSQDTMDQWAQASGVRPLDDWHPPLSTGIFWLAWRVFNSPTPVALAQIIIAALLIAYGLGILERAGVPRGGCLAASILAAVMPVNGTMLVTLWKDIPYSIGVLGLTVGLMQAALEPARATRTRFWVWIGIIGAFLMLIRHNGFVVGFGFPIVMVLLAWLEAWRARAANWATRWKVAWQARRLRLSLLASVISLAIYLIVTVPVYDLWAVKRVQAPGSMFFLMFAAPVVSAGAPMSEPETALWRKMLADSKMQRAGWTPNFAEPFALGLDLFLRNPGIMLRQVNRSSTLVWRITQPTTFSLFVTTAQADPIEPNDFGFALAVPFPWLTEWLIGAIQAGLKSGWVVLWRPAPYLYLALLGVAVGFARSRNAGWLIAGLPILLQSLGMIPATLSQDVRFLYPVQLCAFVLVGLMFLPRANSDSSQPF